MTVYVTTVPAPTVGLDWSTVVPGNQVWNVRSVAALLAVGQTTPTTIADVSPNANNLSVNPSAIGYTFGVAGPFGAGGGVAVNGSQAHPSANYLALGTNGGQYDVATFSFEAIVNMDPAAPVGYQEVVCERMIPPPADDTRWIFGVLNASPCRLRIAASQGDVFNIAATFAQSTWTHIAVTYDGAQWVGYVNGVAGAAVAGHPFNGAIAGQPVTLMGDRRSAQSFHGSLAAAGMFAGVLSGAQVLAHYNAIATSAAAYKAAVLADSPIALWMMDGPGSYTSRTVDLVVTDGSTTVADIAPPAPVGGATQFAYSWVAANTSSASSPNGSAVTVAIPHLVLPAGYTIGTRTLNLDAGDQWSNMAVWWEDLSPPGGPGDGENPFGITWTTQVFQASGAPLGADEFGPFTTQVFQPSGGP